MALQIQKMFCGTSSTSFQLIIGPQLKTLGLCYHIIAFSVVVKLFAKTLLLVLIVGVPTVAQLIVCLQAAIMKDLKVFDL